MGKGWANRKRIARRTKRNYRGDETILRNAGDRKTLRKSKPKVAAEAKEAK